MYYYGSKYDSLIDPLEIGINTIKEVDMYGLIDIQRKKVIDKDTYVSIFLDLPEEVMRERII